MVGGGTLHLFLSLVQTILCAHNSIEWRDSNSTSTEKNITNGRREMRSVQRKQKFEIVCFEIIERKSLCVHVRCTICILLCQTYRHHSKYVSFAFLKCFFFSSLSLECTKYSVTEKLVSRIWKFGKPPNIKIPTQLHRHTRRDVCAHVVANFKGTKS